MPKLKLPLGYVLSNTLNLPSNRPCIELSLPWWYIISSLNNNDSMSLKTTLFLKLTRKTIKHYKNLQTFELYTSNTLYSQQSQTN